VIRDTLDRCSCDQAPPDASWRRCGSRAQPGPASSSRTAPTRCLRRCRPARTKGNGLLVTDRFARHYEDCWADRAQMAALRVAGASRPHDPADRPDGDRTAYSSKRTRRRAGSREINRRQGCPGVLIRGNANPLVRRARITGCRRLWRVVARRRPAAGCRLHGGGPAARARQGRAVGQRLSRGNSGSTPRRCRWR